MKLKTFIKPEEIKKRIKNLTSQILKDFKNEIYIIGVLKGSFVFLSDLIREFPQDKKVILDFIQVKSYQKDRKGNIEFVKDITIDIKNKEILLVDDIFDTGETLKFLIDHLKKNKPKSIKLCTLLYKFQNILCLRKVRNIYLQLLLGCICCS
ncbi:MAG TPA: hypoxanthine phosphoribosyltransferase [Aquificae bacterium]|nr:hypoxanthine phosphoribosyltransferase [Aquificota bacterium]